MKKDNTHIVYLSLGTNLGNKEANLKEAIEEIRKRVGEVTSLSAFYATKPWGFESDDKFLNAAVHYELQLPEGYNPEAQGLMILEICKDIERRMGRTGEPQYDEKGERIYKDRPIDIDILLFGDNRIDCPELTVPHKLMYERDFVMIPLREIAGQAGDDVIPDLIGDQ